MAAQFLTTSRLNNIINMITLGRQSGILRVVRGQGHTREIGQIKFVQGEPVAAILGQVTGPNALTVLMNWGECIYSFDEQATTDLDGDPYDSVGRLSADPGRMGSQPSAPWQGGQGSWPPPGYPSPTPPRSSSYPSSGSTSSLPGFGSQPGYFSTPSGYPPDSPRYDGPYGAPYTSAQGTPVSAPLTASVLAMVPRRTIMAANVEQLPLDRRERMLLLLVDNRRNLSDLARLTRRSEREVLSILEHLAGLGLVQIGG